MVVYEITQNIRRTDIPVCLNIRRTDIPVCLNIRRTDIPVCLIRPILANSPDRQECQLSGQTGMSVLLTFGLTNQLLRFYLLDWNRSNAVFLEDLDGCIVFMGFVCIYRVSWRVFLFRFLTIMPSWIGKGTAWEK